MELETQGFCVDLRALSTLSSARPWRHGCKFCGWRGREYGEDEARPVQRGRLHSRFGSSGLHGRDVEAPYATRPALACRHRVMGSFPGRLPSIARRLAEQTADVNPDQAYLVGLCHSIGSLQVFWVWVVGRARSLTACGWGLSWQGSGRCPGCVVNYFSDLNRCGERSAWRGIVQAAHACVGETIGECASRRDLQPQTAVGRLGHRDRVMRRFDCLCMREEQPNHGKMHSSPAILIDLSCILRISH